MCWTWVLVIDSLLEIRGSLSWTLKDRGSAIDVVLKDRTAYFKHVMDKCGTIDAIHSIQKVLN